MNRLIDWLLDHIVAYADKRAADKILAAKEAEARAREMAVTNE